MMETSDSGAETEVCLIFEDKDQERKGQENSISEESEQDSQLE